MRPLSFITSLFKRKPPSSSISPINHVSSSSAINRPLKSLPQTSGAGAFVAPITFEVLGSTSNLLNIKLPRSSVFNLRYNNLYQKVIAINGKVEHMCIELATANSGSRDPLIYQRCFNTSSPMSILLSLNSQNANYSIIKTKDTGEQWIVKRDSLIAWSGNHLDVSTMSRLSQVAQIKGEGTVAVASPGQIIQIDLSEGESILLNPRSIVAYRTEGESFEDAADELSSGAKSLVDMSIPKVRVLSKIGYYYGLAGEWIGGRWNSLRRFVKERTKQPAKEDIATVKDAVVHEAAVKEEINGSEKVSPLEHADSTAVKDISASPSSPSASSSTSSSPTPSPAYQTFLKIVCRTGSILKTASFSTGRALKRISISAGIALKKFTLTAANKLSLLIGNIASGSRQNYFIEFKGPKTLLIHNAVNLKSEVLTKEEINKLRI